MLTLLRHMITLQSQPAIHLSARQRRFAAAYVVESNGAAAARAAGYSPAAAKVTASRLLRRKDVRAYVETLRQEMEAALAESQAHPPVTADWIAARYQAIASVSAADLWIQEGHSRRQKRPDELTENEREAIASVKIIPAKLNKDGTTTEQQFQYRLYSQATALKALSRLLDVEKGQATRERQYQDRPSFAFTFGSEATSETVARLRSRHGNAGARMAKVVSIDAPGRQKPKG